MDFDFVSKQLSVAEFVSCYYPVFSSKWRHFCQTFFCILYYVLSNSVLMTLFKRSFTKNHWFTSSKSKATRALMQFYYYLTPKVCERSVINSNVGYKHCTYSTKCCISLLATLRQFWFACKFCWYRFKILLSVDRNRQCRETSIDWIHEFYFCCHFVRWLFWWNYYGQTSDRVVECKLYILVLVFRILIQL